ncbi:MAG: hypothetical protein NUV77_04155 [Thermoguttaceae bacterium]|nr:hypothetical protein [Thermoguttaceae bacterium]
MSEPVATAGTHAGAARRAPSDGSDVGYRCPPWRILAQVRDPLTDREAARWVWFFVALGLAARLLRYALRFPLWEDECFLSVNLIDRGYLDLTQALDYYQVAPLLFLWAQRTAVVCLGFNEYALRLVPLLFGVASLFVFRRLAQRLLRGTALVAAVALFAVSYPPIRYAAEAKQYAGDLFAALAMVALAVEWYRRPATGWLWGLAALAPVAVGFSYPAVFVGGGVSLFVAAVLWRRPRRRGWIAWVAFNAMLALSFAALFAVSAIHQSERSLAVMQECWKQGFPPLREPLKLAVWLLDAHTSDMLAYPIGGHRGGSSVTFLLCAAGLVALCRRRQGLLAGLLVAPLAVSFVAAALHRYPYGQMTKFQIFMAPAFCLLAGIGAATIFALRYARRPVPRAAVVGVFVLLAGFGAGSIARDFARPAKSSTVMRARDFARWFWFSAQFEGETVCLKTDLGLDFSPATYRYGLSCLYLCNQRIYSPRHARGEPPRWDRIAADWPLRCVEYRGARQTYDHEAAARWLATMSARYDLVSRERFPFVDVGRLDATPSEFDYVEIYKFVPKR